MITAIKQLFRLIHINWVLAKHGLDEIVTATHFFSPIRFLIYFNPWNWIRDKSLPRGARIRLALEALGPIFVKFGQMLSTRPDLLPDDIITELTLLQDRVPPFPNARVRLAKLYQKPLEEFFTSFDNDALASASIAQVHAATLLTGERVVVKILRPNIHTIIQRDIGLLITLAKLLERYWPLAKRFKAVDIVREFQHALMHELDLAREAANASQLRRNFANSPLLYIPEVYWLYVRNEVMVMERIHGIPIADKATLEKHHVNMKKLAERGVEIFFTQVFRDCFFHADMHPGNIFVDANHPENPTYIAVDFGIMGSLSPNDQRYIAENMLAFFNRDYRRVAQLHIDSGWVSPKTRVTDFEASIRTVCEPVFERPLKDISFGQLLLKLFQIGKEFDMRIQPQLIMLQKTLLHIEGLGRHLYPDLNLWHTAKPYLHRWLRKQLGVKAFIKKVHMQLPYWAEKLPELPQLLFKAMQQTQQKQQFATLEQEEEKARSEKRTQNDRCAHMLFGTGVTLFLFALLAHIMISELWKHPFSLSLSSLSWVVGIAGIVVMVFANWFKRV
jgi:ubiquinone biosynthesis protein